MFCNACLACATKSLLWKRHWLSQPICPPTTTVRPRAAMPFEYPLGAAQPAGCRIWMPDSFTASCSLIFPGLLGTGHLFSATAASLSNSRAMISFWTSVAPS